MQKSLKICSAWVAALTLAGTGFFPVHVLAQSMGKDATYVSPTSGTKLRILLDESNLGGSEVEVAEIEFPPGVDSGAHVHGAVEIFYVLEGELEHIVNGKKYVLGPGMIGHVRPPDEVIHRVKADGPPCKALVIWAPGGEANRLTEEFGYTAHPIR